LESGIVNTPTDKDKPKQNQVMKSVTVDTLGVIYGEPEVAIDDDTIETSRQFRSLSY